MTNKEIADYFRNLHAFLVIAGYDEVHARRYLHLASEIEDLHVSVEQLRREARLKDIQGVGPSTAGYIKEILDTGRCSKQDDWEKTTPFSVIELLQVPGLGYKTAARLFQNYGIYSLEALDYAVNDGRLDDAPGIGNVTLERWKKSLNRLMNRAQ